MKTMLKVAVGLVLGAVLFGGCGSGEDDEPAAAREAKTRVATSPRPKTGAKTSPLPSCAILQME